MAKYKCSYCDKSYTDPIKATVCRDSHDLVYLMLSAEDLNRLHTFIYTKDSSLLSETLLKRIKGLLRRAVVGKPKE